MAQLNDILAITCYNIAVFNWVAILSTIPTTKIEAVLITAKLLLQIKSEKGNVILSNSLTLTAEIYGRKGDYSFFSFGCGSARIIR